MPRPPSIKKTPQPDLANVVNWYGLKRLGYDESVIEMTGDYVRDQIAIETICFRIGLKHEEGGLGRFGHFKNYVDLLWNNPDSGSMKRCVWNPWANRMFLKMCEEREVGIAGPTSAGKCLSINELVLMHDGTTKKADDIQPGDKVMGDDSTPRTVQEVHRGHGPMLKVTPGVRSGGRLPWYCTPEHVMVFKSISAPDSPLETEAKNLVTGPEGSSSMSEMRLFRPSDEVLRNAGFEVPTPDHPSSPGDMWSFVVEPAGDMDWVGFSVDGNHRFLLGDFTVVHNSDPAALYGVVSYTTDPTHTLVLVMSTTIAGAKKRIWKTVREYWESISNLPGKALWSSNEIRGLNYQGNGYGESSGIYLLASEQSNEKAAMDKVIGVKAPRTGEPGDTFETLIAQPEYADLRNHFDEDTLRDLVPRLHNLSQDRIGKLILIIDEMTGMVESLLNAVNTNLKPGNVGHFQIIGLGNPNLPYDPFGLFCKPAGGWDKVDLLRDDEWETETGGVCIRFNGEKNPRVTEGNERFSWMLRAEDIEMMAAKYGRESLFYHRMVLGTWCLNGGESGIYSPADIELSGSKDVKVVWGLQKPTPVSFLDPAFTAGGDRAFATFGLIGYDSEGNHILIRTHGEGIKVDINNVKVPPSYQIARAWKKMCEDRGVLPEHAAYDRTGGGMPFGDIVAAQWSLAVTGIMSSGPATAARVHGEFNSSTKKPILANERFFNRASEIWYSAHPFFRSRQLKGITEELAKELCSRQHDKKGAGDQRKLRIESKKTYKDREGQSPDESDSYLGLVDFCKTKFSFTPSEFKLVRDNASTSLGATSWNKFREKARRLTKARRFKKD